MPSEAGQVWAKVRDGGGSVLSWKSKFYRIFYNDVFSKVEPRTPEESQKVKTRLLISFIEFLFLEVPFVKFGLSGFLRGEGDLALLKDKI